MRVSFHDSHVYPGCAATLTEDDHRGERNGKAVAQFRDGTVVAAAYQRLAADEIVLRVDAYATARQTPIAAKTWKLARARLGDFWKVKAKVDAGGQ